jgi:hypothetical protein
VMSLDWIKKNPHCPKPVQNPSTGPYKLDDLELKISAVEALQPLKIA